MIFLYILVGLLTGVIATAALKGKPTPKSLATALIIVFVMLLFNQMIMPFINYYEHQIEIRLTQSKLYFIGQHYPVEYQQYLKDRNNEVNGDNNPDDLKILKYNFLVSLMQKKLVNASNTSVSAYYQWRLIADKLLFNLDPAILLRYESFVTFPSLYSSRLIVRELGEDMDNHLIEAMEDLIISSIKTPNPITADQVAYAFHELSLINAEIMQQYGAQALQELNTYTPSQKMAPEKLNALAQMFMAINKAILDRGSEKAGIIYRTIVLQKKP